MDGSVGRLDVRDDDLCVVDAHGVAFNGDGYRPALRCGGRIEGGDVGRRYVARHHVVEQDGGQGGDVAQQRLDRAIRQLGEGIVRWREDGERSRSLQGFDQVRRLQGGHQGLEAPVVHGDLNDRGRLRLGCRGRCRHRCRISVGVVPTGSDGHKNDRKQREAPELQGPPSPLSQPSANGFSPISQHFASWALDTFSTVVWHLTVTCPADAVHTRRREPVYRL